MKTFIFNRPFRNQQIKELGKFVDENREIKSVKIDFWADESMTMNEIQLIFSKICEVIGECVEINFSCK